MKGSTRAGVTVAVVMATACGGDEAPTWANGVGELVHSECSVCHNPEGSAPFSLLEHQGAALRVDRILEAVTEGRMPPWLPARDGPAMEGERLLDESQLHTLVSWLEAGAPEGDPDRAPSAPEFPDGWTLGEPDLVLDMPAGYPVPAEGTEIFRNFVLSPDLEGPRWVRAIELRPGNTKVVHHATVRVDPTSSSRLEDARYPLPGFDDMFSRSEARAPGGFFLGWTPGRVASAYPEGMAWQLKPGMDFVVQMHLRPTGDPVEATVAVGIYFTDQPPEEIPLILRLGGQTMNIPPGEANYEVVDEFRVPVAVEALGVYPHAHYLGKTMEAWAETPAGDTVPLLDIPRWDFNWQDAYHYEERIPIPAGSVLKIRYVFDNSAENPLNPFDPPQWCGYGPSSADEMAEFWLQVLPESLDDVVTLASALQGKDLTDRVMGWEHMAAINPDDASAHFALGSHAQSEGRPDEALSAYERALALEPGYAQAHHNIGLIQEERGQISEALRSFEAAVESLPGYPAAWSNLGRLRATQGDLEGARAALMSAVDVDPTHAEALNNLAGVLLDLGRPEEAEARLTEALRYEPNLAAARFNRALALVALRRGEDALLELNRGLAIDGANVGAAMAVAWALATDPDDEARRPELAGDLASQIRGIVGDHPRVLDIQAAVFASVGRYLDAARLAEEGLRLARERDDGGLVEGLAGRLELYRNERPYVRPAREGDR